MQVVIPMTGNGSRFAAAGYKELKPFILIHGCPMVEWVVRLFPGEDNIIFVCRKEHLDADLQMRAILKRIKSTATIFEIDDWVKKGPVYDVLRAERVIDDSLPLILSYCDFYMHWNYERFKSAVCRPEVDGSIPCYTGFHPHLIPAKNVYASCKVDANNMLLEIKEKFSHEADKTKALHSAGIYFFKSGALFKEYARRQIRDDVSLGGEFYASLTYNAMCRDGLKTLVYSDIPHFCQWGTPEDLQEYLFWIKNINRFDL